MNIPDKEDVRADWTGRAQYWDRWADQMADMADRFNQPLIDAIGVAPGHDVLDLASGTGEPALSLARRVGPSGRITATDLVPEMLEGAKRRARAAGLSNIRFEAADMQRLPFPDSSFDRVTCRFGIMFVPDAARAMAEARRVLRPGGRAAMLVWGPPEDTTMMLVLQEAARAVLGPSSVARREMPFRFAADGAVRALFQSAGFTDVEEQALHFTPEAKPGVPFWRPMLDMTLGTEMANAPPEARARLEDKIRKGLEPYLDGAVIRLRVHIRLGTGTVPQRR